MMEQSPENNAAQNEGGAATLVTSLGKTLREAREFAGLSVADVANQLKFAPRQIEALEADDLTSLPEMAFVRGFIRSYAKILNMDAQPLLAALPQTSAPPVPLIPVSVEVPFPSAYSPYRQNLIWLGAALLLAVLVVAFAVWSFTTPQVKPQVAQVETPVALPSKIQIISASSVIETGTVAPVQAAKSTPVATQSSVAQSAVLAAKPSASKPRDMSPVVAVKPEVPAQPLKPAATSGASSQTTVLRLTFDAESWTEIKDKDDKVLSSQVNLPGSELSLNGHAPFSLAIGHAKSVRLFYRGKQVDLTPHTRSSSEVARLTLE